VSAEENADSMDLICSLIEQNTRDAQFVNNQLVAGLWRDKDAAEARLTLIRNRIMDLLQGEFAPSAWLLSEALWPSEQAVNILVESLERDRINRGLVAP
jgi:hypothetical protein